MNDIFLLFIAIPALLVFSAFFSASETSLTGASRALLHRLDGENHRAAQRLISILHRKDEALASILIGNNLINILAASLATVSLTRFFGAAGVFYATLAMTALIVLFAEIVPKSYALANPSRAALALAPALAPLLRLLAPLSQACQACVRLLLRLMGDTDAHRQALLPAHEELRGAIEFHHSEGNVVKPDKDRLGGLLNLRHLRVSDVMAHRKNIVAVDADAPWETIVSEIIAAPYTRLPVWEGTPDNIIGVVHAKTLLAALKQALNEGGEIDIREVAATPWFVPDSTNLQDQLDAFLTRKTHFALIVDEYGEVMGLLTLEDVLEEIVGDIADEHDVDDARLHKQADASVIVDGAMPIRDLNRAQDWTLPDQEATTVAGLVIHEAQAIPDVGQFFSFHGFRFEILERRRNQILRIRIRPLGGEGAARTSVRPSAAIPG